MKFTNGLAGALDGGWEIHSPFLANGPCIKALTTFTESITFLSRSLQ
ncbi:hypothetical protein [Pseudomonas amygdali]|uniref:Uncharacterized protein n=1 Tax=Pseudomonas amygdali pv. lachrymans TaxID=53707 RepID=A0ABR5KR78_PSEAV|nr:hypothetical protein [Pseudomonas amygdali]KPC17216.1 Unknown protein sequence [Pseudomonas amygdali pv. lachrymans]KPC18175.1 Unknown protein sequence [Pseudomonas amygdali pv. lachrymans]RMT06536.1 hypothetical protein ALP54_102677 [Pseudomonas amygdali pv. lachrymans]